MSLTVLNNRYRLDLADEDLLNLLFNYFKLECLGKVCYKHFNGTNYQEFSELTNIYTLKSEKIWFSHITTNNNSFFCFGEGKLNKTNSNVPKLILDFPLNGIDTNSNCVYAQNKHGSVYVLIRQISTIDISNLEKCEVFEGNDKKDFFVICQLNSPDSNTQIKQFLIDTLKNQDFKVNLMSKNQLDYDHCSICGKDISQTNSILEELNKPKLDKCVDCQEKILAVEALKQVQKYVSMRIFNEENLLEKVADPEKFKTYLAILKKQNIILNFSGDSYIFSSKIDLDQFVMEYNNLDKTVLNEPDKIPVEQNKTVNETKTCSICNKKLEHENFYKSDTSSGDINEKCKECTRKAYCVKALKHLLEYVDPKTPFNKEDLFKVVTDKIKYLDYIWTLQEFNLLDYTEKSDSYTLKPEDDLNKFIEKYGDKSNDNVENTTKITKKKSAKVVKTCEICNQTLSISNFYKSNSSEDGFSLKCKECSRKSHAAKALKEMLECEQPGVSFNKTDFLDQCENRIQFLDYFWTLLELDLLKYDEKNDSYTLEPEETLNNFIEQYGENNNNISQHESSNIQLDIKDNPENNHSELENEQTLPDNKINSDVDHVLKDDDNGIGKINRILEISKELGSNIYLEFNESVEKKELIRFISNFYEKVKVIKLIELSVKPKKSDDLNYNVKIKLEVKSDELMNVLKKFNTLKNVVVQIEYLK